MGNHGVAVTVTCSWKHQIWFRWAAPPKGFDYQSINDYFTINGNYCMAPRAQADSNMMSNIIIEYPEPDQPNKQTNSESSPAGGQFKCETSNFGERFSHNGALSLITNTKEFHPSISDQAYTNQHHTSGQCSTLYTRNIDSVSVVYKQQRRFKYIHTCIPVGREARRGGGTREKKCHIRRRKNYEINRDSVCCR